MNIMYFEDKHRDEFTFFYVPEVKNNIMLFNSRDWVVSIPLLFITSNSVSETQYTK